MRKLEASAEQQNAAKDFTFKMPREDQAPLTILRDEGPYSTRNTSKGALPSKAVQAVQNLGAAMLEEVRKKESPTPDKPDEKTKPLQRLRISQISTVRRIRSIQDWENLRDKLDARVRKLLDEGNEVELD